MAEAMEMGELRPDEEEGQQERGGPEDETSFFEDFLGIDLFDESSEEMVPDVYRKQPQGLPFHVPLKQTKIILKSLPDVGFTPKDSYGPNNTELLNRTKLRVGKRGLINGLDNRNNTGNFIKLVVRKGNEFLVNVDQSQIASTIEFTQLMERAKEEFKSNSVLGRETVLLEGSVGNIQNQEDCVRQGMSDTVEELENEDDLTEYEDELDNKNFRDRLKSLRSGAKKGFRDLVNKFGKPKGKALSKSVVETFNKEEAEDRGLSEAKKNDTLSPTEQREIGVVITGRQIINQGKEQSLEALSAQKIHLRMKQMDAANEDKPNRELEFSKELRRLSAQEDIVEMIYGELPMNKETLENMRENIVENDLTRLERFKKWARENLLTISGVAIMAATLITSIIALARKTAKLGAKGVSALGKSLSTIAKKLGPILGPIFSLMGSALSLMGKGASWLSKNLWLLALLMVYALFEVVSKRTKR